jgi:hypothetical protein
MQQGCIGCCIRLASHEAAAVLQEPCRQHHVSEDTIIMPLRRSSGTMTLWSASKTRHLRPAKPIGAILLAAAAVVATSPSWADCQSDVNGLMKKRMSAVAAVNATAKKNGGKLDPVAACPQLRSLAAIEGEAQAYFTKNADWCNLPPDFSAKMSEAHAKTQSFATKACSFAVKMKEMQKQQAQQAAEALPKLPTGPL